MSSRRTRRLLAASAATAFALVGTACGAESNNGQAATDGKIPVVASTNVWGSVLSAVGGDRVAVTAIIHEPSADPHSYETTPEDAVKAQGAKLLLSNGGGYDDFFGKLADQAQEARKLVAVDVGATGDDNEHVWYSLPTVRKVADQVAAQLGEVQPDAKQTFTGNAATFKAKIEDLLKKTERIGTAHPDSKVVATEPVAHYLLESAKVGDATPEAFAKAVEEETDVPAAALDQVKRLIAGKRVKALVNNEQTTTPVTQQVVGDAKNAGVPVVGVSETLPSGTTDYIAWMTKEVDALAGALGA